VIHVLVQPDHLRIRPGRWAANSAEGVLRHAAKVFEDANLDGAFTVFYMVSESAAQADRVLGHDSKITRRKQLRSAQLDEHRRRVACEGRMLPSACVFVFLFLITE
jgi:uncharacterized protein (DUF2126 family)